MDDLRVAVIGCGYWAPNIIRNLLAIKGVRVEALCDLDPSKANDMAERFSVKPAIFTDYRNLCIVNRKSDGYRGST